MKRAQDANRRFARSFGTLRAGVVSAINPFHALGQGVAALAGTYGFVALIRRGEEFNKAMAQSQAIMSGLTDTLRVDMRSAAIEMSKTSIFSATESARAFFYLASAGLDAEKSIAALPIVTKFAQAGMFDLARATDLVTDAQSALGLSVKDAQKNLENMTRVSDVLVKANTLANATVEQFSEALTNKAGAALRIVNKDIEEGVAVLAAFADQGTKGAEAGTAFGIIMRDLQTKALQNAGAFKQMNIEVFDAAGRMNNLADILADLENALNGMSDAQKKATLLALGFSDKSIAYVQAVIGMSDKIRDYETALRDAGGTTARVAEANITPMQRALNALKGEWDDMTSGMQAANNVATAGIHALGGIVKMLRTFGKELVMATAILGGFKLGIAVAPLLIKTGSAIMLVVRALGSLTAASKLAAAAQATLLAFAGPAGWAQLAIGAAAAVAAIGAVDAAFQSAAQHAEGMSIAAQEAVGDIKDAAEVIGNTVRMPSFSLDLSEAETQLEEFRGEIQRGLNELSDMLIAARNTLGGAEQREAMQAILKQQDELIARLKEAENAAKLAGSAGLSMADAFGQTEEANKSLDEFIASLEKTIDNIQQATDGYAKLAELMQAGADPALLTQAEELLKRIDFLKASADANQLAESLRKQINELRMGATEAALYELALKGVADTTLEMIRALQAELDLLNEQEEIMRRGQQIWEQTRTPLERYNEALKELQELLAAGAIDWETYQRAIKQAEEELDRFNDRQIAADEREQRTGEFRQVDLTRTAINGVRGSDTARQKELEVMRSIQKSIEDFQKRLDSRPVPVELTL